MANAALKCVKRRSFILFGNGLFREGFKEPAIVKMSFEFSSWASLEHGFLEKENGFSKHQALLGNLKFLEPVSANCIFL